jgi:prevent-host-death family protein
MSGPRACSINRRVYPVETMAMKPRAITAARFTAQCLTLLDEVAETGVPIVVIRRGGPIARVLPVDRKAHADLKDSVVREGDLLSPIGW